MAPIDQQIDIMARTMWGEARGEGTGGMLAVGLVIYNRAASPRWWGKDIISVCHAPRQFSCWNVADPNHAVTLAVTPADNQFAEALDLAAEIIVGGKFDITMNADHYHADYVNPAWAKGRQPVAIIGRHRFYRLEI